MSRSGAPAQALQEAMAPGAEAEAALPLPVGELPATKADERRRQAARLARAGRVERLFYALGMNPGRYLLTVALPLAGLGAAMAVLLPMLLVPFAGPLVGGVASALGGLLLVAMAALLPFQAREGRRAGINQQMHVFITHLGVLSTTPMARVELFGTIASKKAYGPLAGECARVYGLVKHWHVSLPEACRFIAARTPSELLGDFLDRLAHALEAGDQLEEFLINEQSVVMHQYASHYERGLYDLETYRDLFSSLMMSAAFLAVFALLMPVLANVDVMALLPLVLLVTGGLLLVLLGLARSKTPRDPLWVQGGERNEGERRARLALPVSLSLALAAGAAAVSLGLPMGPALAVAATPPVLASAAIRREEEQVRRRDDNYPAFIRSLGAGAASRSGAPQDAVEQLQRHDYGPLTPPLRRLHRRLVVRVDTAGAWRCFAAETGSHLIHTFNGMFLEGAREGGNAMKIGGIISRNAAQILSLRKQRAQVAAGLRGTLLGMAGALSFTLYLNLGIVTLLTGIFQNMDLAKSVLPGIGSFRQDLGIVEGFVLAINLAYAAAASVAIRMVSGGRVQGALSDFAAMLWIGVLTSTVTRQIVEAIL